MESNVKFENLQNILTVIQHEHPLHLIDVQPCYPDYEEFSDDVRSKGEWIQICLHSARTSTLVNGSPASEFSIKKGLRQGDPLSPFLFILVMEGLHVAIKDACQANLIKGVTVGTPGIHFSHFFYADDVVLVTDWNHADMDNILQQMAQATDCSAGTMPFTYLGLPIGVNMNSLNSWQDKDKKKTTWVKWENILASKEKGGLGIIRFINRSERKGNEKDLSLCRINAMWEALQASCNSDSFEGQDEMFQPCVQDNFPKKSDIFLWRLNLDRLPHRLNLSRRGLEIQSISCPGSPNVWKSNDSSLYTVNCFTYLALVRDQDRYMRDYVAYEQFVALCEQEAGGLGSDPKRTRRTYISREREEAEQRLIDDYFGDDESLPKYPEENLDEGIPLPEFFYFFRQRYDAVGRKSIGPILKCTSAIRQLAYGTALDAFDEYLQIAERGSRDRGDGVTGIKRRRRDLPSDDIRTWPT
ncbi:RNA-directed DNA polymerase, eukaryota, reverse transcriptase zinc-binding domain protein [Tanacetum coccineum]|uniref:RNA-directed DNA polymerase, eukaryota, reverse transcriptase zinc-binding domain protein n=1 Tax=Tanacetum coccineum TaxID=301880 RepID=A0ABQ4WR14_9ASTR